MRLHAFSTLALFIGVVSGFSFQNVTTKGNCTSQPSAAFIAAAELHFATHKILPRAGVGIFATTLKIYWHVVSSNTALSGGNIPDSQIDSAISILNHNYASTGVSFVSAGIDRTVNANWFNSVSPGSSQETAMKTALYKGGAADLNVYTVGFNSGAGAGLLGYSTYPWSYSSSPTNDGVVIQYSTVSGSPIPTSKTLTHHTGHWLGLYDTYSGGCSPPGDYVDDTPPEAAPPSICTGQDTCGNAKSFMSNNYMDGPYEQCGTKFTPGQATRIKTQLSTYRGIVG